MDKKGTTFVTASLTVGGVFLGMLGLTFLTDTSTPPRAVPVQETVQSSFDVSKLFQLTGEGLSLKPTIEEGSPATQSGSLEAEEKETTEEERKFKEDFYVQTQNYLNKYQDQTFIATWEDKTTKFFHEMKPNGDIYFKVSTIGSTPEHTRELFCLGEEGKRTCWTRNSTIPDAADIWFSLEEPYLIGSWEFPSLPTKSSPEWFLARGLSTVNCNAARFETEFKETKQGFKVMNRITAVDERGEYLGDQKTFMKFDGDEFTLTGSVKDAETGEVRHRTNLLMRPALLGETYEKFYPSLVERLEAPPVPEAPVQAPPPPGTQAKN